MNPSIMTNSQKSESARQIWQNNEHVANILLCIVCTTIFFMKLQPGPAKFCRKLVKLMLVQKKGNSQGTTLWNQIIKIFLIEY